MLAETIKKYKSKISPYEKDIILVAVIIMVAIISFGLGRLSKIREGREPIIIGNMQSGASALTSTPTSKPDFNATTGGKIVASKNSTKYHYPWCSGAQSIKEENKIWFSSIEEARKAGYIPASNCKGLK